MRIGPSLLCLVLSGCNTIACLLLCEPPSWTSDVIQAVPIDIDSAGVTVVLEPPYVQPDIRPSEFCLAVDRTIYEPNVVSTAPQFRPLRPVGKREVPVWSVDTTAITVRAWATNDDGSSIELPPARPGRTCFSTQPLAPGGRYTAIRLASSKPVRVESVTMHTPLP